MAIDALACSVLKEDERGLANGVMFGAAQAGQAIGGAGVVALKEATGSFGLASLLVPGLLLLILSGVAAFVFEKSAAREMAEGDLVAPEPGDSGFAAVRDQVKDYVITAGRTIFGNRNGLLGLAIALLPAGGLALSMVVSTLIAPRLGMSDGEIAKLNLMGTLIWVPCCLAGGWFSDRFGRRMTLGIFSAMSIIPGLWVGWKFSEAGWVHPPQGVDGVWPREDALIHLWWIASLSFSVFNGLLYGIRTAFFMDIVNPRIAATHFTALMAMTNLVFTYTSVWQGRALSAEAWHWTIPRIFICDSVLGVVFLALLPFVRPHADSVVGRRGESSIIDETAR